MTFSYPPGPSLVFLDCGQAISGACVRSVGKKLVKGKAP